MSSGLIFSGQCRSTGNVLYEWSHQLEMARRY